MDRQSTKWRDYLLIATFAMEIFVVYLLLNQSFQCSKNSRLPTDPQLSVKLRGFIKQLGEKLEWDVDSKLSEIEETIQNFQQQQIQEEEQKDEDDEQKNKTVSSPTKVDNFAATKKVLNCQDPAEAVVKFSQVWANGETYQGCADAERLRWAQNLTAKEKRVFSQNGEDGITEAILQRIGEGNKFFVEFGVQDGSQCNTRILREKHGWKGVMFDSGNSRPDIGLYKTSVWIDNILELFSKHNVPKNLDFLSIDTDFGDFWLLETLLAADYRPRVFVIEINNNHGPLAALTVPLQDARDHKHWSGGNKHFGTSVNAVYKLASNYGYELLYIEKNSVNAFFVKRSEISNTNLAQLAWISSRAVSTRMVKMGYHKLDTTHQPFTHICAFKPCESSKNY